MFNSKNKSLSKSRQANLLAFLCASILSLTNSPTLAVCGMGGDDEVFYGNAEICLFKEAIEGTEEVTAQDKAFLSAVEATRVIDRGYMRVLLGKPKQRLQDIGNNSMGIFIGLSPSTTEVNTDLLQFVIAGGYVWSQWAAELELYFSKRFTFDENPAYSGMSPAFNASAKVSQFAVFFNIEYIIPRLFTWYPTRLQIHLDAGVGPALIMTDLTTLNLDGSTRQSGSKRTIAAAANLGLGARYQATAHILLGVSYRYFFIGKTNFGPVEDNVQYQANKQQANGFFFEATYQF